MTLKRAIEAAAVLILLALLLLAGWRDTWAPLMLAAGVLALRWVWRVAPLLVLAMVWWPHGNDE